MRDWNQHFLWRRQTMHFYYPMSSQSIVTWTCICVFIGNTFVPSKLSNLRSWKRLLYVFSAQTNRKVHVFGHERNTLGMDCTKIRVFKKSNQVCLCSLLKSKNCHTLESHCIQNQICFVVIALSDVLVVLLFAQAFTFVPYLSVLILKTINITHKHDCLTLCHMIDLRHLSHDALEGQLGYQCVGRFLIFPYLSQCYRSRTKSMWPLDIPCSRIIKGYQQTTSTFYSNGISLLLFACVLQYMMTWSSPLGTWVVFGSASEASDSDSAITGWWPWHFLCAMAARAFWISASHSAVDLLLPPDDFRAVCLVRAMMCWFCAMTTVQL